MGKVEEADSTLKVVTECAHQIVTHVSQSVKLAISLHLKWCLDQTFRTVAHVANDLKASESRSDASLHHEIADCAETLSKHSNSIKAASSEVALMAKAQFRG